MTRVTTHCRSLTYEYDPETGLCTFPDGVTYTVREMIFLARCETTTDEEDAIHLVKRIFGGEIDTTVPPHVDDWLSKMGRTLPHPQRVKRPTYHEPLQQELDL